jgi:hybrid polyketide synthase/nonribosomal peptide synthetase ACE1
LQVILQLEQPPKVNAGSEKLGIDSFVAVEIRSWFLKELGVDIPVLKILGGATVEAMVVSAMEKLPAELTPNLKRVNATSTEVKACASVQVPVNVLGGTKSLRESSVSTSPSSSGVLVAESPLETSGTELSSSTHSDAGRKLLMSYGQSRFWFMSRMLEDQGAFNIVFMVQLTGTIDVEILRSAFRQITYRHSTLRTRFVDGGDTEGLQEILTERTFQLESRAVSSKQEVDAEFTRLKAHEYDLASAEVMQISLLSQSQTAHWLAVGYHHINMDSMSLQIMLKDLDKAYRGQPLSRDVLQYSEFAARQRAAVQEGHMQSDIDYWTKEFLTLPPTLPLLHFSKACIRQPHTSYAHARVDAKISSSVSAAIKATCARYRITPFHFHLVAFQTLLTRLLNVDDICIGMTDANRTEIDELESLGLYLNMLPLRLRTHKGQRFSSAVKLAQTKVRNALAHSRLPFDVLVEQLKPERSMDHSPLFQTYIDYKPPVQDKLELFGCMLGSEQYDVGQTAYDLMLSIVDDIEKPGVVMIQVQCSLYSEEDAGLLMRSYMWSLEQFGEQPEMELKEAILYAPGDLEEALLVGRG